MKKAISLLLTVVMIFTVSACSSASSDKNDLIGKWNIVSYRDTDWGYLKATIEFTEDNKMIMGLSGMSDTFGYSVTEDGKILGTTLEGEETTNNFNSFSISGDTLTLVSADGTYICKKA